MLGIIGFWAGNDFRREGWGELNSKCAYNIEHVFDSLGDNQWLF